MNKKEEYNKLKAAYPSRRIVRVLSVTKAGRNVLSPKMRWLWSCLVWRYKFHMVSKHALARWSGLHRTTSLPKMLAKLERLGLVEKVGTKYRAVKPKGDALDWIASYPTPNGKRCISYNWAVYIRGRDILDGLVEAKDSLKVRRASLLASYFGVCRQTISAARKRLAGIGLDRPSKGKDNPVVESHKPEPREPEVTTVEKQTIQETIKTFEMSGMQGASNAERLAHQHGITEPDTVAVLSRVTATVFKGLAYKEQSQIVGSLVKRFGTGEGLEDYLYGKLPAWTVKYGSGILSVESFLQAT